MVEGSECLFHDSAAALQFHHLRQIADTCVLGHGHRAGGGLLLTGNNLQKRGFAGTVLAREGYAVALTDNETHAREQRARTKFYSKVLNRNHVSWS